MAFPESIEYKLFHARCHAQAVVEEIERYYEGNPGALIREESGTPEGPSFRFRAKRPIPACIPLRIGDTLQNLRSVLDYLIWELVISNKGKPGDRHMFPICESPKGFKDALKRGRLSDVPNEAQDLIEGIQPYYFDQVGREHSVLAILDELVNINKHRKILTTVLNTAPLGNIQIMERDGNLYGYGSLQGDDATRRFVLPVNGEPNAQFAAFMQINEGYAKGTEVSLCINALLMCVEGNILPLFDRFLG